MTNLITIAGTGHRPDKLRVPDPYSDRTSDGKAYEALQLTIGKLSLVVADAGKRRWVDL